MHNKQQQIPNFALVFSFLHILIDTRDKLRHRPNRNLQDEVVLGRRYGGGARTRWRACVRIAHFHAVSVDCLLGPRGKFRRSSSSSSHTLSQSVRRYTPHCLCTSYLLVRSLRRRDDSREVRSVVC